MASYHDVTAPTRWGGLNYCEGISDIHYLLQKLEEQRVHRLALETSPVVRAVLWDGEQLAAELNALSMGPQPEPEVPENTAKVHEVTVCLHCAVTVCSVRSRLLVLITISLSVYFMANPQASCSRMRV